MNRGTGQVRIIGGRLRGRRLPVPEVPGLRPTPDRVRETLFNWLAPHVAGMRVLDLFAGSGALGLEALSRGAATLTLVEQHRAAQATLRDNLQRLGLPEARLVCAEALTFLATDAGSYNLILLDPPFAADLLAPALMAIERHGRLAAGGFCYIEMPADAAMPPLPAGWVQHRSGRAGEVGYHLLHDAQRDLSGHV